MTYTNTILVLLGVLGILLHNLVELNKINRDPAKATFTLKEYFKLEVYSILISLIVVIVAAIIKVEITQLEIAGKWLGLAFLAIGYMGQSLLIFVMGKANKVVDENK
jgi:heme/copper-type cytochrome/quinol oxidase subunit 2